MRWIFRLAFLLLILAGGGLGIAYPWLTARYSGYEIGTWRAFDGTDFVPVETRPAPSEVPLFVSVQMITHGPLRADRQGAVLTLTARDGGRAVLETALDFAGVQPRTLNPQTAETAYRTPAGRIDAISGGPLSIEVQRGSDQLTRLVAVDVTVEAGAIPVQPNAIPIGYVLLGVGFVGFMLSFRGPKTPKAPPPPPTAKWGRQ